jgi:hypothetical protein
MAQALVRPVYLGFCGGGQFRLQPAFSRLWPPKKAAAANIGHPTKQTGPLLGIDCHHAILARSISEKPVLVEPHVEAAGLQ